MPDGSQQEGDIAIGDIVIVHGHLIATVEHISGTSVCVRYPTKKIDAFWTQRSNIEKAPSRLAKPLFHYARTMDDLDAKMRKIGSLRDLMERIVADRAIYLISMAIAAVAMIPDLVMMFA